MHSSDVVDMSTVVMTTACEGLIVFTGNHMMPAYHTNHFVKETVSAVHNLGVITYSCIWLACAVMCLSDVILSCACA